MPFKCRSSPILQHLRVEGETYGVEMYEELQ